MDERSQYCLHYTTASTGSLHALITRALNSMSSATQHKHAGFLYSHTSVPTTKEQFALLSSLQVQQTFQCLVSAPILHFASIQHSSSLCSYSPLRVNPALFISLSHTWPSSLPLPQVLDVFSRCLLCWLKWGRQWPLLPKRVVTQQWYATFSLIRQAKSKLNTVHNWTGCRHLILSSCKSGCPSFVEYR